MNFFAYALLAALITTNALNAFAETSNSSEVNRNYQIVPIVDGLSVGVGTYKTDQWGGKELIFSSGKTLSGEPLLELKLRYNNQEEHWEVESYRSGFTMGGEIKETETGKSMVRIVLFPVDGIRINDEVVSTSFPVFFFPFMGLEGETQKYLDSNKVVALGVRGKIDFPLNLELGTFATVGDHSTFYLTKERFNTIFYVQDYVSDKKIDTVTIDADDVSILKYGYRASSGKEKIKQLTGLDFIHDANIDFGVKRVKADLNQVTHNSNGRVINTIEDVGQVDRKEYYLQFVLKFK